LNSDNQPFKEYDDYKQEILSKLGENDYQSGFSIIRQILRYPGLPFLDSVWKDVLSLFHQLILKLGAAKLADTVAALIEDPLHVEFLYNCGYYLYEKGLYDIAATFLLKANEVKPQQEKILSELAINLEWIMANQEIVHILENSNEAVSKSMFLRYLLAYNYIMSNNLEKAKSLIPSIEKSQETDALFYAENLRGMLNRAYLLKPIRSLDHKDLRGWHMLLNGTLLLHLSPFGYEENMYGRYGYIADSYSLLKLGLTRIKSLFNELEIEIPFVISLPDRSSQILSHAASRFLERPLKQWDEVGANLEGLYIAYDLDMVNNRETLEELNSHKPNQILWVHASCWTNPFPYAPDITTFLYQHNVAPWSEGRMRYDDKTKKVEFSEPNSSPVSEIANMILEDSEEPNPVDDDNDFISVIEPFLQYDELGKPGIFRNSGSRLRQRIGSPVKCNMFY
jgi:tetratricopeptide (TPR) repeat protein